MKKHKLLFIFILFTFNPFFSHAQYFDWVERYTGSEATGYSFTNRILQSVVDANANIYFVGTCAVDAGFHDSVFLPFTPYGPYWNTASLVIGKISSEGNLLWSKVIHSNNSGKHTFGSIQIIGDTAVSLFVNRIQFSRASPNEYLFYLDTLLPATHTDSLGHTVYNDYVTYKNDTLYDYSKFCTNNASAYTVFDLNGNVLENHWLTIALLDPAGEPLKYPKLIINNDSVIPISTVSNIGLPFTVDKNGNIAILNALEAEVYVFDSVLGVNIKYNIQSPEVSGLRIYVNSKRHFDVPLPDIRPSTEKHNYQILKFSPHFDSLLASQFLFEPTPEHLDSLGVFRIYDLEADTDNNIFLLGTYGRDLSISNDSCSFQIGGSEDVRLHFSMYDESRGFLLKYDSSLTPVYLKQIGRKDVDTPSENNRYYDGFNVMQFDDNGNIALLGATAYNDTVNTRCWFDSTELKVKGFLILRVDPDDGRLVSCKNSEISSPAMGSSAGNSTCLVAKNNRLVTQLFYRWYLNFADSLYEKPREYEWGMGFAVWDYDGNELCFVDYGTNGSASHSTSSVCLVDSVLYLTGMLASGGAQFGDVTVPNSGSSQSFIARYVDTAFMHPYVHHGDLQDIQLVVRDGEPVATVYPNPCAQRVTVDWDGDEPPLAATVTDITGRTYSVALTAAGAGQSDSEAKIAGRYTIDFSSLPAANYLLTLTTPSGHRVTTRLLKR